MVTRALICLIITFTYIHGDCQNWVERTRSALPKTDMLSAAETYKANANNFLFYSDSSDLFEKLIHNYFAKTKTWKHKNPQNSSLLNELCKHVVLELSFNKISKKSHHRSYLRKLNKALVGTNRTYAYIEFITFDIPVVKISGNYFYDTENGDSPYFLYKGKAPNKKELESGTFVFAPCQIYTEQQIAKKIESKMRSSRIYSYLLNSEICSFGVSAIPKKRTFYRKAIPTIRVFVIVGIKRINEKKLGSGWYRAALRRQKRKTEEEIKNLDKLLKRSRFSSL